MHVEAKDAPTAVEYFPKPQESQALWPEEITNFPATHEAHLLNPVVEATVPGEQLWQVEASEDPTAEDAVPMAHNVHDV